MKKLITILLSLMFAFNIIGQTPPQTVICLATVDPTYDHNVVVWDRTAQSSSATIDSIYIYRRHLTSTWDLLDVVDYASLSEYHDTTASIDAGSSTYMIAGKDVNGVLGLQSDSVRTIHFSAFMNAQDELWLDWTPYLGAAFTDYQCWYLNGNGNGGDSLLNTAPNSSNGWAFGGAQNGFSYEMSVDVSGLASCSSTKANHNTTRSNQTQGIMNPGGFGTVSINENSIVNLKASPVPSSDFISVQFSSLAWVETSLSIYDLSGRKVFNQEAFKAYGKQNMRINISGLTPGIYMLILDNGQQFSTKIIKQ